MNLREIIGKTITKIEGAEKYNDVITFHFDDGRSMSMFHRQECCESVNIEEIIGDVNDLIGSPILVAKEDSNYEPQDISTGRYSESNTWTFYEFATIKGLVTIRWHGSSNGYYSESVTCEWN